MLPWEKTLSKASRYENVRWGTTKVVTQVSDKQKMICFLALGVSKCHQLAWPPNLSKAFSHAWGFLHSGPTCGVQRALFLLLLAGTVGPVGCIITPRYHFKLEYKTFPNVKIPSSPLVFQFIKTLNTNFLKLRNAFINITACFITIIPAED